MSVSNSWRIANNKFCQANLSDQITDSQVFLHFHRFWETVRAWRETQGLASKRKYRKIP